MTCIVGLFTKDGRAFVGGDSGAFTDEGAVHILPEGKVFKSGAFVVGCAGSRRFSEVFQHVFEPPDLPAGITAAECDKFMTRVYVSKLRECLKAEGCFAKTSDEEGDLIQGKSGAVIAVPRAGVYYLSADFACTRAATAFNGGEAVTATGGGMKEALGAMLATPEVDPVERITNALEVCSRLYNCCLPGFTVLEAESL